MVMAVISTLKNKMSKYDKQANTPSGLTTRDLSGFLENSIGHETSGVLAGSRKMGF